MTVRELRDTLNAIGDEHDYLRVDIVKDSIGDKPEVVGYLDAVGLDAGHALRLKLGP